MNEALLLSSPAPVIHSGQARLQQLLSSTLIAGGSGGWRDMPPYLLAAYDKRE
jgi:hypothetical protein